jgi:uncharacterized protein (TIGR00369 family)
MGIRVESLSEDWRHARIHLPLNRYNSNPGGGMFGGAIASLADPIAALACNRIFPGHQVWTRAMHVDFLREGRTDLVLQFDFDEQVEREIGDALAARGRATPSLEYGFYDTAGRLCVKVVNTVAIRPRDYRPSERLHHE